MESRALGKSGIGVSAVGFGAWAIGADWGEPVPADVAKDALHAALDAGCTTIDTADIYGGGRSESLIGEVLAECGRRGVVVLTKMGRGQGWSDSVDDVRRAAEGSLQRLGVPALDLVQLHCVPFATLRAGRAFAALEKLREEGLVRSYGVSVETIEEGLFCIGHGGPDALQVIYNIFRQRVTDELLPAAAAADVGIIARVPLASGLLSGKFDARHRFEPGDHRSFNADGQCFNVGETFAGVPFAEGVGFAREVEAVLSAESPGATLAQKALRWVIDHPEVSTVIPGARSAAQARANAAAAALPPLSQGAHRALRELYQTRIGPRVRGAY
jgi:aryl-alcohol dehydrogenase-like predicted oxidoreductase